MTREEKDKCLRKLQYIVNRANWGTIDRDENGLPLGIRYASDVATAIENDNQADLLKEFVEWLKGVYAKDYDDKGKIADKSIGRGDKENFWYMEGQQTALQRIITLLDKDLEKFLEERK